MSEQQQEVVSNGSGATPVFWCLLSAALFGASTPASKVLLGEMGPLTLAGLLYVGAAVVTLPLIFEGGNPGRRRERTNLMRMGGAVLFGGVLGPIALLIGLTSAPAASVSLWLNFETTATALFGWLIFREHLDARAWTANILVVVAGVMLVTPDDFVVAPAAFMVLLAAIFWGLDNSLTAIIDAYTPSQMTFIKGVVAGVVNIALGQVMGEGWSFGWTVVVGALLVGALSYGLSIVLYIKGAQLLGAVRSQMIFASAPFLGMALSWVWLGEEVLGVQIAAGVVMAIALALLINNDHSHHHIHEPLTHTHTHRHDDGHHNHTHEGLPPEVWHTHEHSHEAMEHCHDHLPDMHHRHTH